MMKPPRRWLGLAGLLISLGGCDLSTHNTSAMKNTHSIPLTAEAPISVMGRVQFLAEGGLRFGYPGVSLRFSIQGRSAALVASSTGEQSYVEILVDDQAPRVVQLSSSPQPITLFETENPRLHHVEVIHRSETWHGLVTAHRLNINDGDLLPPSTATTRKRLLILGDSVTCGEAVERSPDCKKTTRWWNPRLSYGMLLAKALDAQVHLVCYGGRGLVRSWNGKTDELNLPDFFELTIVDPKNPVPWDHQGYQPDLILSAIGTNDFSTGVPERESYINAYEALVRRLLHLHPQAQIALTEGAILNGERKLALQAYLTETARRINDPRVHVIPSQHYPGDACDTHPTGEQHAAMARDFAPIMRELMQW